MFEAEHTFVVAHTFVVERMFVVGYMFEAEHTFVVAHTFVAELGSSIAEYNFAGYTLASAAHNLAYHNCLHNHGRNFDHIHDRTRHIHTHHIHNHVLHIYDHNHVHTH